jgi:hypothetical protein
MPYKQAAEQRQELPSRSIARRRRPAFVPSRSIPRRRRPEFVPAGRVHAIDTDTREVACGINAAGLYVFDRDWASGIGMDWCPACVEATGYGRPPHAGPHPAHDAMSDLELAPDTAAVAVEAPVGAGDPLAVYLARLTSPESRRAMAASLELLGGSGETTSESRQTLPQLTN